MGKEGIVSWCLFTDHIRERRGLFLHKSLNKAEEGSGILGPGNDTPFPGADDLKSYRIFMINNICKNISI